MATVNRKIKNDIFTHGGSKAVAIKPIEQLERSVMSCLLWENEFYEEGESITQRIAELVKQCSAEEVADIAIRAKRDMRIRHVPLFLTRELLRTKEGRKQMIKVIPEVIVRPDDITELLAMYIGEKKGRTPAKLPNQLRKHLGEAFEKFSEYQFAKYNGGKKAVTLKDAVKLTHPVATTPASSELYRKIIKDELKTPDTWEVELSSSKDKKASWTRLLAEKKLGGLALLRNIRNITQAGVDSKLIKEGISGIKAGRLLPINFIAAAKHNPQYETSIEEKLLECLADKPRLMGKTILIIDTSGSMHESLSGKSELDRRDAAAGLAMIAREICEDPVIYCTAGNDGNRIHATMQIPARKGFALRDYICGGEVIRKIGGGGIFLVQCLEFIKKEQKTTDRIIVITDEQDCDTAARSPLTADTFGTFNYLINVASAKNGVGYRKWTHIDGWSDKVIDFIIQYEKNGNNNAI